MAKYWIGWFDELALPGQRLQDVCWRPSADIYRLRGGWLVKFDLAGIRPEDIRMKVSGSRLTVAGTRRDCQIDEGQQHYRLEIAYSRFERSVEFPCSLD